MVRRATKKDRKRYTRERKEIILIATEGKNKTERNYFREFNRSIKGCAIVFSDGNNTDPVNIVHDALNSADKRDIEPQNGDSIYAVFDTDFKKGSQISEARKLAERNGVEIILSNPCFEVWLLLHLRYSTRGYQSNNEVIKELNDVWPEYRKNIATFKQLRDRCEDAIENTGKLKKFHNETKGTDIVERCNPSTDVDKLVTRIIEARKNS